MNSEELIQMSSRISNPKSSKCPKLLKLGQEEIKIASFIHKCMVSLLCNKLRKKLWKSCSLIKSLRWMVNSNQFKKIFSLRKCSKVRDHIKTSPLIFKFKTNKIKRKKLFYKLMTEKISNILLIKTNSFKKAKKKM